MSTIYSTVQNTAICELTNNRYCLIIRYTCTRIYCTFCTSTSVSERRYDGGSFFSPDSKRLLFRAYHPTDPQEQEIYIHLRDAGLVSPSLMELFTVNVDGSDMRQLTSLGGSNWAPYYHPDAHRIIFASNYPYARGYPFNLFLIDERNTSAQPERVTYDADFDSFPMFSRDGSRLIWASGRNATQPGELNLFIADWIDNPSRYRGPLRHAASPDVRRRHRVHTNNDRAVSLHDIHTLM